MSFGTKDRPTVKGSRGRKTFSTAAERIGHIALHVLCAVRLAAKHAAALHKIRKFATTLPTEI